MRTVHTRAARHDGLRAATARVYDAECALHVARQTRVDAWISAAGEKLHRALVEYLAAREQA